MDLSEIIPHIEVLIFASEKPLTALDIVELINNAFGFLEERVTLDQIEAALDGIREKYNSEFYPFEVKESGGGWQFLTKKDYHKTIAQLNGDKFLKRLSNAALETLAIIAYKQPIKVIIESGVLTNDEIIKCCDIYGAAGIDYLKTSTGYAEKGSTVEAVQLFRRYLPGQVQIKASGGIRDYAFAKQLIEAGATRLGCSASVAIMQGAPATEGY